MKKLNLTLLLFLTSGFLFAQNYLHPKNTPVRLGITGGYNLSRITNSQPSYTVENYSGYSFGGSALWQKWGNWGLKGDLFFSRQGYRYHENGANEGYLISSYAYLSPGVNFKPIQWMSFFGGMQLGALLKANCGCGNTDHQSEITKHFNRFDYGVNGGVEFSSKSIAEGFILGLKYYYGLSNIVKNMDGTGEEDVPIKLPYFLTKNSVMNFYLGYRF